MTILETIFLVTGILLAAGIVNALVLRSRAQRVLGDVLDLERGPVWPRFAVAAPAAATAIWVALELGLANGQAELLLLCGTVVYSILCPSAKDRISGSTGVRVGWQVLGHAELVEWRLIGEHLRFRLLGEWAAVPLPMAAQDAMRLRLDEVASGRESSFGRGSGRPAYDPAPESAPAD